MNLVDLLVLLIILGVGLYLVNLIPMDSVIKRIIQVLVILVIVVWLLRTLGFLANIKL